MKKLFFLLTLSILFMGACSGKDTPNGNGSFPSELKISKPLVEIKNGQSKGFVDFIANPSNTEQHDNELILYYGDGKTELNIHASNFDDVADGSFRQDGLRSDGIYNKQGLEYFQGKELIVKATGFADTSFSVGTCFERFYFIGEELTYGVYEYKGNNTFDRIGYLKGDMLNPNIQEGTFCDGKPLELNWSI